MNLPAFRESRRLSAAEFGRRAGVAHSTVLRWEDGSTFPSRRALARIAEITGGEVTPNDFMAARKGDA